MSQGIPPWGWGVKRSVKHERRGHQPLLRRSIQVTPPWGVG